ncbi:twitching motility protein PilT [Ruficoccus amylovorans]|uniref:Twitching motility protein PilT n=1 Tax=Ruficoccus amylovorans TaxID=1804625 RepID=A0A842HFR8_9BACT|nr:twitching motility protein PilT [Ruficoccus amylovorans]MBC2595119.1 twitching motility protein PilT [Ruficoccus amylovorans]
MKKTIFIIRVFFFILCIVGAWLIRYAAGYEGSEKLIQYVGFGALLGAFTILTDIYLKGFSLRGLTALTFGLAMGALIAMLISISPLFERGDPEIILLVRMSLYIVSMYLGAVIALRGRDEFNLVIPYVRFVPQKVDMAVVVLDTSALIDGRVVGICKSGFLMAELVVPRFIMDELQRIADSKDPHRQSKGRKGLQVLNELRKLTQIPVSIHESEVGSRQNVEDKLIFVTRSLKAKLLTTDYNLARLAEFQGVSWLNINELGRALNTETSVGEKFEIELVKAGKERDQAVGYLSDGSMVVVNDAVEMIGQNVHVEVISVMPSAGGKLIFARLIH